MLRIPPAPIGALALLIAYLAVPWGAAPAIAQESADRNGSAAAPQQERGFVMLGVQRVDVGGLNDRLAATGYPAFPSSVITVGGGGMGVHGGFLIGGEGHGLLGPEESTADGAFRTRLGGGYGMFTVGRDLFPGRPGSLYPQVGVGGGAMTLRIDERSTPTFEDLLENPRRSVEISRVSFLLMGALGGDYLLGVGSAGPDGAGVAVGVRVGYMAALGQRSWSSEVGSVAGGPDLSPTGPFIRFQVGAGARP
ncbi:MAG: hypothetical protein EA350_11580 [Gemmatimonadales bacterium]|nr:MAG: hypothetical protein EA350_11580 [Gemmatimonadales bacterium]